MINRIMGRTHDLYFEAGCDFTHAFGVTLAPGANRQTSYILIGYKY